MVLPEERLMTQNQTTDAVYQSVCNDPETFRDYKCLLLFSYSQLFYHAVPGTRSQLFYKWKRLVKTGMPKNADERVG